MKKKKKKKKKKQQSKSEQPKPSTINPIFWGTTPAFAGGNFSEDGCKMEVNGLFAEFNMPPAIKSKTIKNAKGEEIEVKHGLPPYGRRKVFEVDKYPACPTNWMHGSSKASSYFVPIKEEHGMWLDFNRNKNHTHDVAIVISIQGVNPITGQKTDTLNLEQYKENCPVHNVPFKQGRFCEECKYEWPKQNYLCTTGQPWGFLWLDGFRKANGQVRQYIFTEEEAKGVAKNIIGKDRVFAIGVGFYLSKNPKPKPVFAQQDMRGGGLPNLPPWNTESYSSGGYQGGGGGTTSSLGFTSNTGHHQYINTDFTLNESDKDIAVFKRVSIPDKTGPQGPAGASGTTGSLGTPSSPGVKIPDGVNTLHQFASGDAEFPAPGSLDDDRSIQQHASGDANLDLFHEDEHPDVSEQAEDRQPIRRRVHAKRKGGKKFTRQAKPKKNLEVGAGTMINQKVHADPKDIDFWEEEPAGMIYINYCDEQTVIEILEAGIREEKAEGFLDKIPVGND
jgi:hypothetical protein